MKLNNKIPVAVLGATGTVGQRFVSLLMNHPWFELVCLAASERSAGKNYGEALDGRWTQVVDLPEFVAQLPVFDVIADKDKICQQVRCVFSAFEADKDLIQTIELAYADAGAAVISNNSAHRWTEDVALLIPEVNPEHLALIDQQRQKRGWSTGLLVAKPNCSIQCYVPILRAWESFMPEAVVVSTYQAISGAGKTFVTWPEMIDNIIPYIGGEEEKSELEPQKVLGRVSANGLELNQGLKISASCIRVPVSDGHFATVGLKFKQAVSKQELIDALANFVNPLATLGLPSAPKDFIVYHQEMDRPQHQLDRDFASGMSIHVGRLREDKLFDWKFVALSHNTMRGAAGGAVLIGELLVQSGYIR